MSIVCVYGTYVTRNSTLDIRPVVFITPLLSVVLCPNLFYFYTCRLYIRTLHVLLSLAHWSRKSLENVWETKQKKTGGKQKVGKRSLAAPKKGLGCPRRLSESDWPSPDGSRVIFSPDQLVDYINDRRGYGLSSLIKILGALLNCGFSASLALVQDGKVVEIELAMRSLSFSPL